MFGVYDYDLFMTTNPVEVHVGHIFIVDLQHVVSLSEVAVLCGAARVHISDLKASAVFVPPQVEAKALPLQTLEPAQPGQRAVVGLWTHGSIKVDHSHLLGSDSDHKIEPLNRKPYQDHQLSPELDYQSLPLD